MWTIIRNLTDTNIVVEHGLNDEVRGMVLTPAGNRGSYSMVNPELWRDSVELKRLASSGQIEVFDADQIPEEIYFPPDSQLPTSRELRAAVMRIVLGPEDQAMDLINMTAIQDGGGAQEVDRPYMTGQFVEMLTSSVNWMENLKSRTTSQNRRLKAARARIKRINNGELQPN